MSWLFLAVGSCYASSLQAPFLFDDPFPDIKLDYSTRPLVSASFALNRAWTGGDTWSYHVFNTAVHLACGLALLGVLRRSMAAAAPSLASLVRENLAYVTALLWLCHPLQTGAVTYISQRAESMAVFFYLVVFYAFLRSTSAARPLGWQALSCLALALGFATKEIVATAPVLLFLFDALFLATGPLAAWSSRRWFYAALVLLSLVLSSVFLVPPLLDDRTMGLGFEGFGAWDYARTQPGVLLHYLKLTVWPHPLCFDYGWPIARDPGDYLPQSLVIVTLLLVSLFLLVRRSWIGFAAACFFLVLAPTSSFIPIQDPAFEHRMYLPLAAPLLLLVVAAWWSCARYLPGVRRLPPALALGAAVGLAFLTVRRNQEYRSPVTLLERTVALAPHNARAHIHLGADLLEAGRAQEAIAEVQEGLRLDPSNAYGYLNLGKAYLHLDQIERALPFLERGVELVQDPRFEDILGGALFLRGEPARAVPHFEKALEGNPEIGATHRRLAQALAELGRAEEAIAHYEEALRLDPGQQDAHVQLGALLLAQGRAAEALEHAEEAARIAPDSPEAVFGRAQALRALGRFADALSAFRATSALAPELPEPYAAFAQTVCMKPDASPEERGEARRLAEKSNELTNGMRPELLAILAETQAALGDLALAIASLDTALALPPSTLDATFAQQLRAQRDRYLRRPPADR